MTVQIWALKVPEMTLSVSEFKIHNVNGTMKREKIQTTKFYFYHDPEEDLATKLQLTMIKPNGEVIRCQHFSQFSSYNASYNDDENYFFEGDYIFEDVSTEDIYKIEDLSEFLSQDDPFEHSCREEEDNNFVDSLSLSNHGDEGFLVPGSDFDKNYESSPHDVGDLIPGSPEPGDRFKDLLFEPLLYHL